MPSFDPHRRSCHFDRFLIVRSGFLQHKGSAGNGCVRLAGELAWHFGGGAGRTRVELEAWDDDPRATAEFVYRLGRKETPPTVCVFAYSWGCGYGFVRLAEALGELGVGVRAAVLCDPVYHGLARWRALIPRTLFRRVRIRIPANVDEVHWFRQFETKPAGHDLKPTSPYTRIHDPVVLDSPHTEMDNRPEFHQRCLRVARQVVGDHAERAARAG